MSTSQDMTPTSLSKIKSYVLVISLVGVVWGEWSADVQARQAPYQQELRGQFPRHRIVTTQVLEDDLRRHLVKVEQQASLLAVHTNSRGHLTHLGKALFDVRTLKRIGPFGPYLERIAWMYLPRTRIPLATLLDADKLKIYWNNARWNGSRRQFEDVLRVLKQATSVRLTHHQQDKEMHFQVRASDAANTVELWAPASLQLLGFSDKPRLEEQLLDELEYLQQQAVFVDPSRDVKPRSLSAFDAMLPVSVARFAQDSLMVHDAGQLITGLTNQTFFIEDEGKSVRFLHDSRPRVTISNLLLAPEATDSIRVRLTLHQYRGEKAVIELSWHRLAYWLRRLHRPYARITAEGSNATWQATTIWHRPLYGYVHLVRVQWPQSPLRARGAPPLHADMWMYIRQDNMAQVVR